MYTIRIDNIDEYSGENIEQDLTDRVNAKLAEHNMNIKGIRYYPMSDDTFLLIEARLSEPRLREGRTNPDTLLAPGDWQHVNQCVNKVLDDLNFCALVRSRNFYIRQGKKALL